MVFALSRQLLSIPKHRLNNAALLLIFLCIHRLLGPACSLDLVQQNCYHCYGCSSWTDMRRMYWIWHVQNWLRKSKMCAAQVPCRCILQQFMYQSFSTIFATNLTPDTFFQPKQLCELEAPLQHCLQLQTCCSRYWKKSKRRSLIKTSLKCRVI